MNAFRLHSYRNAVPYLSPGLAHRGYSGNGSTTIINPNGVASYSGIDTPPPRSSATLSNRIEEIVHESFQGELGKSFGASELASWKHSLRHMDNVLDDAGIPDNAGVAIEFNIPQTGKRVDFIVTGNLHDETSNEPRMLCSLGLED